MFVWRIQSVENKIGPFNCGFWSFGRDSAGYKHIRPVCQRHIDTPAVYGCSRFSDLYWIFSTVKFKRPFDICLFSVERPYYIRARDNCKQVLFEVNKAELVYSFGVNELHDEVMLDRRFREIKKISKNIRF